MPTEAALPLAGATVRPAATPSPLGGPAEASPPAPAAKPLLGAARAQLPSPISDVAAGRILGVTTAPFDPTNVPPFMSQLLKLGVPELEQAGVYLFETAKAETVFYNPSKIDEASLRQAEQNGTLYEITPPVDTALPTRGAGQAQSAPSGPLAGAALAPAPRQPAAQPFQAPPASLQNKMATARTNNIVRPAGGRPMSPVAPNPITSRLGARTV